MKFTEMTKDELIKAQKDKARASVSPKDKWNLKMDVEDVKKDFIELQNTAEKLPDEFVKEICDTDTYPFDEPVDETQDITNWCSEVDDFLKGTENFGMPGNIKESIFNNIYNCIIRESYTELQDLSSFVEHLSKATLLATKLVEEGENESIQAQKEKAIADELKQAKDKLNGFNLKLNSTGHEGLASVTAQDLIYSVEDSLKKVLVCADRIVHTNNANRNSITDALGEIGEESLLVINNLNNMIQRLPANVANKLKNMNNSRFIGSFNNLREFRDNVLGGKYTKIDVSSLAA